MKKLVTILSAVLLFTASSFASGSDEVPSKVKSALQKTFSNATNVTWEKTENLYNATFNWGSFNVNASFDENGNMMSVSRKLSFSELPLKVSEAISKAYSGYTTVGDATEVIVDDVTQYHLQIENDKQVITLTSSDIGELSVDNKVKK